MADTKFKKLKENFTCVNCGAKISGDGYTNHCPHCLWSRHVDVYPGDRSEECGGPMEPISAKQEDGKWVVFHKCLKCHSIKKIRIRPEDNFDVVVKLVSNSDVPLT